MIYRQVANILGNYLFGFSFALFIPLLFAIYEFYVGNSSSLQDLSAFLLTILICIGFAGVFSLLGKKTKGALYRREGLASVVIIWLLTPAIAALPFLLNGTLQNPFQAYFEATSGLTTTGATILSPKKYDPQTKEEIPYRQVAKGGINIDYVFYGNVEPIRNDHGEIIKEGIEAVSRPLLLWRSFLNWIGGVGIVVIYVAILPAIGGGNKILFYTEMPGPVKETLTPRVKETASLLWKIYLGLTLLQIVCLMVVDTKMPIFDAITTTFATISTGGFSIRNANIGAYHNANIEWVIIVFMLLGSINFTLFFFCLRGKFYRLYDPEFLVYLGQLLLAGLFVAWWIAGTENVPLSTGEAAGTFSTLDAIRTGFFHVVSAQTSTGFSTVNYDIWPYATQVLITILIFCGGMSGSTCAGIKIIRLIMLFRIALNKLESMFRPSRVRSFRIGDSPINSDVAGGVLSFFLIIIALSVLGVFLLTVDGVDPQTTLSVITTTINCSGFGFQEAGPLNSYAFLSNYGLSLTCIWMILGRLEFFAVLVFLVPAFWKQNG